MYVYMKLKFSFPLCYGRAAQAVMALKKSEGDCQKKSMTAGLRGASWSGFLCSHKDLELT